MEHWSAFFIFVISIIFTPGPVNLMSSSITVKSGWKDLMLFLAGVNFANLIFCSLAYWGVGQIASKAPQFEDVLKILGALFIFYLAYKNVRAEKKSLQNPRPTRAPGFGAGFLINITNVKTVLVFSVIFVEFVRHASEKFLIASLTVLFCVLSQLSWGALGSLLKKYWTQDNRRLSYLSSTLMFFVGIWILFH